MKLLFASQNQHKRQEMAALLLPHTIVMPREAGIPFAFEEVGSTFIENALGKARHLHAITGEPSIADDSGLVVDRLNGAPGVRSARYGSDVFGYELDAAAKNRYLLENLRDVPLAQRSARFVCAMALVLSPHRAFVVQETVEGSIAGGPSGEGGFGYDPVFLVGETGRTMAQLSDREKNSVSHRGLAAKRMLAIIQSLEQEEIVYVC